MLTAVLAFPLLSASAPGCGADTCQGASSKICDKACACGGACDVQGVKFASSAACSAALTVQCNPTKHDIDWAACSTALDTAQCQGGSPDGGTSGDTDGGTDGGAASMGVLLLPKQCSAAPGADGGVGGSSSASSSATSSGSM
jgi:hypothetical protein